MSTSTLNKKAITATKWSTFTEILAKLVSPITTMVLARLLTPDAFGILVTATMVISFAEIFTDAGFQKYLIQHEFKSTREKYKSTTVAFWSNLTLSLLLWAIIIISSDEIAKVVGNEGYGDVIAVSCACIPLAAFSSIQMALYKRALDFKTLFQIRMVGISLPLIITIPIAYFTHSYWSLICGMIALNLSNAILLTIKSPWKPQLYFSFRRLKEMFSFTFWSMFEAVSIWLTGYIDIFIIGLVLNQHYLGIYRVSISTVGQITAIITTPTIPILFSTLSRLQNDRVAFNHFFLKFQKTIGLVVMPLSMGIFIFQDLITTILLGSKWAEAGRLIGLWGLVNAIVIVTSYYCSEVFRALGKPKISFYSHLLHLCFIVPTVLWSINYGFEFMYEMRAIVRLQGVIVNLIFLYTLTKITPINILYNLKIPILGSILMLFTMLLLPTTQSLIIQSCYVIFCCVIYLGFICLFKDERNILQTIIHQLVNKLRK